MNQMARGNVLMIRTIQEHTLLAIFSPAWGDILFLVRVCKTDMMSS